MINIIAILIITNVLVLLKLNKKKKEVARLKCDNEELILQNFKLAADLQTINECTLGKEGE